MVEPDLSSLPSHFKKKLENGKLVMFRIRKSDLLANGLIPLQDKPNHYSIKPLDTMTVEEYRKKIRNTQRLWEVVR